MTLEDILNSGVQGTHSLDIPQSSELDEKCLAGDGGGGSYAIGGGGDDPEDIVRAILDSTDQLKSNEQGTLSKLTCTAQLEGEYLRSDIKQQKLLKRLDNLFNTLCDVNRGERAFKNISELIRENVSLIPILENKVDFQKWNKGQEEFDHYHKRIECSIRALGMLYEQGYDFDQKNLYSLMHIATTKEGDLQELATKLLIQQHEGHSLLESFVKEHILPKEYPPKLKDKVDNACGTLSHLVQDIEKYDLEDQKHIIQIMKVSFDTENFALIRTHIPKFLELLAQNISHVSCKQEDFLKSLEEEFSDLLKHNSLFLLEQRDVCEGIVKAVQNILDTSDQVDGDEKDQDVIDSSEEISEEAKIQKSFRLPIPKVEHDGRDYYEAKEAFKLINKHLPEGFIENKLFKKLDKQFEEYKRSYKSPSNVYSCLEILDHDNKDPSANPLVRIKHIDEYREEDIRGWAEAVKQARIEGKSLKQVKEEAARRNITLINKHYLQNRQATTEGKPERREKFDDDGEDGEGDDDHWRESETRRFEDSQSKEALQEKDNPEDNGVVLTDDPEFLGEILAVIKQAHRLEYTQILRDVQIFANLLFFYDPSKGALIEIKTGEGKSTITAIKSVIWHLKGERIDIFTSAEPLAIRDTEEKANFFELFGLSVTHNCDPSDSPSHQECYSKDVVYGNISNFQFDNLRDTNPHESKKLRDLDERPFSVVLVDEVDSTCIDNVAKIAMMSSPTAGSDMLAILYACIVSGLYSFKGHFTYIDNHKTGRRVPVLVFSAFEVENGQLIIKDESGQIIPSDDPEYQKRYKELTDVKYTQRKFLESALENTLENRTKLLPACFEKFIKVQEQAWIKSAMAAATLSDNQQFIIYENEEGELVIAPVDLHNTGVILSKTQWTNGQHQILQLLHFLMLQSESLVTNAISVNGTLNPYGLVFGITGTVGNKDEQDVIKAGREMYVYFLPTNKESKLEEPTSFIAQTNQKHQEEIKRDITTQAGKGRAVLVICPTIKDVNDLYDFLKSESGLQIRTYCRGDTDLDAITKKADSRDIIIATNLAGRGTDIKTTKEVEEAGGLHVILTSLPKNQRVEKQNIGRTARSGNKGSAALIIDIEEVARTLNLPLESIQGMDIKHIKCLRDELERARLYEYMIYGKFLLEQKDELFEGLRNLTSRKELPYDRNKYDQVEEFKGPFVREVENELSDVRRDFDFEDFIQSIECNLIRSGSGYDSLFQAVSNQVNHGYITPQLKFFVLKHFALSKSVSSEEDLIKVLADEGDKGILQAIANILGRHILLVNDDHTTEIVQSEEAVNDIPLRLGVFVNSTTKQTTYHSVRPWNPEQFSAVVNAGKIKDLEGNPHLHNLVYNNYSKIYFKVEKNKSVLINERIERLFKDKIQTFKDGIKKEYSKGLVIYKNPAILTKLAAQNNSIPMAHSAIKMDPHFSAAAEYLEAQIRFKDGGNKNHRAEEPDEIDNEYVEKGADALERFINKIIDYYVPHEETIIILSDKKPDTPLHKQRQSRLDLYKRCIEHVQEQFKIINDCNYEEQYVAVSDVKPLSALYEDIDKAPKKEVEKLQKQGLGSIFELKLYDIPEPEVDFWDVITIAALAVIQITIGFVCINFGFSKIGMNLIIGGLNDIGTAIDIFTGKPFSWNDYWTQKGVAIAIAIATEFGCRFLDKMGWLKGFESILNPDKILGMREIARDLAKHVIIDKTLHLAQKSAAKGITAKFKKEVKEEIRDKVEDYFDKRTDVEEKICKIIAADKKDELMEIIRSTCKHHQNYFAQIFRGALSNLPVNQMPNAFLRFATTVGSACLGAKEIIEASKRINQMLAQIDYQVTNLANSLPSQEEIIRDHLTSLGASQEDVNNAISCLQMRGILANGKINVDNIPSGFNDDMDLPLAFRDRTVNIKNELRAVAAKHNNYNKVVGRLKNVVWANATNYITGRINEHLSTKFVNTFTYPLEQKLSETLHNFFHDTFDVDGKGKLSKEEKKKLKEEKKLEKQRDQERVAKQLKQILDEQEKLRNEVQYGLSQDEESPVIQSAWQFADKPNPKPCVKPKTSGQKAKAEPADKTKQEKADQVISGDHKPELGDLLNEVLNDIPAPQSHYISAGYNSPGFCSDSGAIALDHLGSIDVPQHDLLAAPQTSEITLKDFVNLARAAKEKWDTWSKENPNKALALKTIVNGVPIVLMVCTGGASAIPQIAIRAGAAMVATKVFEKQIQQASQYTTKKMDQFWEAQGLNASDAAFMTTTTFIIGDTALEASRFFSTAKSLQFLNKDAIKPLDIKQPYVFKQKAADVHVPTKTSSAKIQDTKTIGQSGLVPLTTKDGMPYYVKKVPDADVTWDKGPVVRGKEIEIKLEHNLHKGFPVIDKIDRSKGIVTSIKSRDIDAKTYQNTTTSERIMRNDIDKVAQFKQGAIGDDRIYADEIKSKVLEVVVPNLGNTTQQNTLKKMRNYGVEKNVEVKVIVYQK